jgi:hypothetical protein
VKGLSDQEFNVWLDFVEKGGKLPAALPPDDTADLALASRLLALRAVPTPRLGARVGRILAPPSLARSLVSVAGWQPVKVGGGILAALLLLACTLAFTPAGSWAQGVLQRFGVTFLPGAMPQWSQGLPEVVPTRSPTVFSSETEVQTLADFPVRWPAYFPFDRDRVTFLGYATYTKEGAWIESLYGDTESHYLEVQVFWRQRPGPWPVGDARFQSVDVAGWDGLWGEGVPASFIAGARRSLIFKGLDGSVIRVGDSEGSFSESINVLLWEEGEILYILIDPDRQFSRADLLRTAESAYQDP